jgi:Rel homology DNA-binding domain
MGIIHTAKRHIKGELLKKIRTEREFELNRPLTSAEGAQIEREADKQAKEMNLNQVCLCFQAFIKHEADNVWVKICDPVYSNVVNNLKSALYGGLRITRMSTYTSEAKGGQEIFMFVEKVCKSESTSVQSRDGAKFHFLYFRQHQSQVFRDERDRRLLGGFRGVQRVRRPPSIRNRVKDAALSK